MQLSSLVHIIILDCYTNFVRYQRGSSRSRWQGSRRKRTTHTYVYITDNRIQYTSTQPTLHQPLTAFSVTLTGPDVTEVAARSCDQLRLCANKNIDRVVPRFSVMANCCRSSEWIKCSVLVVYTIFGFAFSLR